MTNLSLLRCFNNYLKVCNLINEVESTTAYQALPNLAIEANQVTAVYLSPQDPDYFKANSQPVALYRYRLKFLPLDVSPQ